MTLTGYDLEEILYEGSRSRVYRARQVESDARVVIKVQDSAGLSAEARERFEHEYELNRKLSGHGAVTTLDFRQDADFQAIVFEDRGGVSLRHFLDQRTSPPPISLCLEQALSMTGALERIHEQNIIHRDVNPANFIWLEHDREMRIIDFGLSTEASGELTEMSGVRGLEGTLAYISPEQTGRTSRVLDYRSDYYSLGATFYRMLTGRPPFESDDPLELIHGHIALTPPAPHEIAPQTPEALSTIVLKLLAKNPEDRYQSAAGLRADLKRCAGEWKVRKEITPFEPGAYDVSHRFELPARLYGREQEVETLMAAFERAREGRVELLLVAGYSGIGKSSLVNEIHRPIVQSRGHFIRGKFDQYKQDVPYSAIIQAFSDLIRRLLTEDEPTVERWRQKIQTVVGENGRIITDIIPEVARIIGPQPELTDLGPVEAQNRFRIVFQNFVRVFADAAHPLALFLDDLQWIDPASLEMLVSFLQDPETRYLLVIGSYRDNEVDQTHPLMYAIDEIERTGLRPDRIALGPLSAEAMANWFAAGLRTTANATLELARLVEEKTRGNPFFAGEFLKKAKEENLLEIRDDRWQWDLEGIRALQSADNVVQLMAGKISGLPADSCECLKIAAAIGNRFELKALAVAMQWDVEHVRHALRAVIGAGLTVKIRDQFHFAHDRIQEAAYSLIAPEDRAAIHLRIGRLAHASTPAEELPAMVFYLVNHFNLAAEIMTAPADLDLLRELNRMAGRKARSSAAYEPAFRYLRIALNALLPDAWQTDYQNTLELHSTAAEAAFLAGETTDMEQLVAEAERNVRAPADAVDLYLTRIMSLLGQNLPEEALEYGLSRLRAMGSPLPARPGKVRIIRELLQLKLALRGKDTATLLDTPAATDPRFIAVARLQNQLASPAYFARPELFVVISLNLARQFVRKGFLPEAASVFCTYAIILCGELGEMQEGRKFGQFALDLVERLNARMVESRARMIYFHLVQPWTQHARDSLRPLRKVYEIGVRTGDFEFASYGIECWTMHLFYLGRNFEELFQKMQEAHTAIVRLKQDHTRAIQDIFLQSVRILMDEQATTSIFTGPHFDESKDLQAFRDAKVDTIVGDYYVQRIIIGFLLGEYETVHRLIGESEPFMKALIAQIQVAVHVFYAALNDCALARGNADRGQIKQLLADAKRRQKKMATWAHSAPMNFAHKAALIQAEIYALENQPEQAAQEYARALKLARQYDYPLEEALIQEQMGRFWLQRGQDEVAALYLGRAWRGYRGRSAHAVAARLERDFPELLAPEIHGAQKKLDDSGVTVQQTVSSASSSSGANNHLDQQMDLNSILKISRALSGEIVLEKLLTQMMKVALESAGADRGVYISCDADSLQVEAEACNGEKSIRMNGAQRLDQFADIARSAVHYAVRTGQPVVLNNAADNEQFAADEYLQRAKPGSALCLPIQNRSQTRGLLYLENRLNREAFTPERLRILSMLSGQIAVSLENARLYTNLEDKVKERTEQLRATLEEVQALKCQQDGDYYLTSQLVKPFGTNRVDSELVHVEFLLRQKKQFDFKHWHEEIGGDFCAAHMVQLRGRSYVVFLNADAMGKSIQGAGGALVLGAVFQTFIERTTRSAEMRNQTPDSWLRECIKELHIVFAGFDGSMLMSLVAGIFDETTGKLLFVNAEHPFTVLYRGGTARFLEKELVLHKLGNTFIEKIPLYRVQLQEGDVVIAGSDGRDDILMSDGQMNEEETEFLRRVEEGQGNLQGIYSALQKQGEIMDDLSMIRLKFLKTPG